MRILLIRHGETVDNVAQIYAGVRDSALTSHGSLQADKLGECLRMQGLEFTHIFSSDLQRAFKTADAILRASQRNQHVRTTFQQLPILREQDFGSSEGKPFHTKLRESKMFESAHNSVKSLDDTRFKDPETKEAMGIRMNTFVEEHLYPLLPRHGSAREAVIAIVSHGIILSHLWRCILGRFALQNVRLASTSPRDTSNLGHIGPWSNTGYLDLEIQIAHPRERGDVNPYSRNVSGASDVASTLDTRILTIKAINSIAHLKGLKRTGGGVGSSKFDDDQKKIEHYFKKRKV